MKKYFKWIIMAICLIIFIITSVMVYTGKDIFIDSYLYEFIDKYFISDNMTSVVKVITFFGSTIGIIAMCFISLFIIRNKKYNIMLIVNLICATIINNYIIKLMFMRERPSINPLTIENTYSYPSGHSMVSMAFYGYLIYLIYNHISNRKIKYLLISILSVLIFLIGISRVYLGVHYTSDVIGGFCFGISYIILFVEVSKKIIKKI